MNCTVAQHYPVTREIPDLQLFRKCWIFLNYFFLLHVFPICICSQEKLDSFLFVFRHLLIILSNSFLCLSNLCQKSHQITKKKKKIIATTFPFCPILISKIAPTQPKDNKTVSSQLILSLCQQLRRFIPTKSSTILTWTLNQVLHTEPLLAFHSNALKSKYVWSLLVMLLKTKSNYAPRNHPFSKFTFHFQLSLSIN